MIDFVRNLFEDVLLSIPLIGAYVIFALGIVVIFRASRVLNLAHGAMAMAPAYVYYQFSTKWHLPVVVSLVIGIASGAALGYIVERAFVRPLRKISPTAQTVGTVAAFGLIVAIVAKMFGTLSLQTAPVFPNSLVHVGSSVLRSGAIGLFFVGVLVAGGLYALFRFTDIGLAMRAAADNRRAASLMGVDPQRTTTMAWMIGGATAAVAGILLGAATNINPYTLSFQALPAFVTVLLGGLESLLGAIAGGTVVGIVIGIVPLIPLIGDSPGASQLALMVMAFVVMILRGQRFSGTDVRGEAIGGGGELAGRGALRPLARLWRADAIAASVALVLCFPALPFIGSNLVADANVAMEFAMVGLSLVTLIGLVGQISLAQASFVGIGAFVTGQVINHLQITFPANLPIAALAAGVSAALLGVVALRVRGLYLAVATLIFAWMCDSYLFQQTWLVGQGGSTAFTVQPVGAASGFPHFDLTDRRTFYYIALATIALVAFAVHLIRRSKTGRAFFAVRGSEMAAASLGINVTRYKLLGFAISGVIAGMAGNLIAVNSGSISTSQFTFTMSLFYLSIAVVGGLSSIGGSIAAGVVFAALNELFFQVDALSGYLDIVSAGLLTAVLLAYPGGLAAIPSTARRLLRLASPVFDAVAQRTQKPSMVLVTVVGGVGQRMIRSRVKPAVDQSVEVPAPVSDMGPRQRLMMLMSGGSSPAPALADGTGTLGTHSIELVSAASGDAADVTPDTTGKLTELLERAEFIPTTLPLNRADRAEMLAAEEVSMRFGGLLAVDNVSMTVREGEIVGLIGPNGAGKTTTFNCISGLLVPTSGRVTLFGKDVTSNPVHERARMGLGRTFQVIQLFPQLSVFENLLVATHGSNPTGVLSHVLVTKKAVLAESSARNWVQQVVSLLGLDDVSDRPVGGLPFGVLRMVEVARAVVSGAQLIMLDEPASGLDNTETQRLADLLMVLRRGLGLTLLLIEHDVKMVTSVSDYMYVLDRGRLLAEGTPREIQSNAQVIAAYLGEPAVEGVA